MFTLMTWGCSYSCHIRALVMNPVIAKTVWSVPGVHSVRWASSPTWWMSVNQNVPTSRLSYAVALFYLHGESTAWHLFTVSLYVAVIFLFSFLLQIKTDIKLKEIAVKGDWSVATMSGTVDWLMNCLAVWLIDWLIDFLGFSARNWRTIKMIVSYLLSNFIFIL
jgi:hypothetical protein